MIQATRCHLILGFRYCSLVKLAFLRGIYSPNTETAIVTSFCAPDAALYPLLKYTVTTWSGSNSNGGSNVMCGLSPSDVFLNAYSTHWPSNSGAPDPGNGNGIGGVVARNVGTVPFTTRYLIKISLPAFSNPPVACEIAEMVI